MRIYQPDRKPPSNQSHSRYTSTLVFRVDLCVTGTLTPALTSTCCLVLKLTCT